MRILGIDPGIAITGYGVIDYKDKDYEVIDFGVVETHKSLPFSKRLEAIYTDISEIIEKYNPDEIAIEELFFAKNTKTAMVVSQARGVIVLACVHKAKKTFEYTPLQVKQGITGYGKANKAQVTKMVTLLLNLKNPPKPDDAADALAIAMCHSNTIRQSNMILTTNKAI